MEAGKKRLAGDTARAANTDEVKELRREAKDLKEVVAEQTLELRLLKKPFRVGARLCAVETACAMLRYEGQRPFAYWWFVLGQNPVKKRGPWVHANLRVVTLLWQRSRLGR